MKYSCPQGYTHSDLESLFGDELPAFYEWMNGQTMSICDGRAYDHDKREYYATECADNPHGAIAYAWDVERYASGQRIIYD